MECSPRLRLLAPLLRAPREPDAGHGPFAIHRKDVCRELDEWGFWRTEEARAAALRFLLVKKCYDLYGRRKKRQP